MKIIFLSPNRIFSPIQGSLCQKHPMNWQFSQRFRGVTTLLWVFKVIFLSYSLCFMHDKNKIKNHRKAIKRRTRGRSSPPFLGERKRSFAFRNCEFFDRQNVLPKSTTHIVTLVLIIFNFNLCFSSILIAISGVHYSRNE